MPIVGAVSLLFVLLLASGCVTSDDFWDRSPRVAGERQVATAPPSGCAPYQAPPAQAAPRWQAAAPSPSACAPSAGPAIAQVPYPHGRVPAAAEEMRVLAEVNRIRAQHALRPLRFQPLLWAAARDHSAEQARSGVMGHGSPDPARRRLGQRMQQAGYQGRVYAEVVAWGFPDVPSLVEGWMNSPEHRHILLDPELSEAGFSRVGEYWTGNLGAPARAWSTSSRRTPRPAAAPARRWRAAPAPRRDPAPVARPLPRPTPPPAAPVAPRPVARPAAPTLAAPSGGFG